LLFNVSNNIKYANYLTNRRFTMTIKTTTLSILAASLIVTACVGNNIKQEEIKIDTQKTVKKTEITKNSEIVLSDFPIETTTVESTIKSNSTDAQLKSGQPISNIVNFNFDKFKISDVGKSLIQQHAEYLIKNPSYVLTVNGHSDYRGPEIYNEKLSLRRANSVASLLISFGAPESQIIVNSFGASQPIENYDNWYQNRRVEFEYSELYMVSK